MFEGTAFCPKCGAPAAHRNEATTTSACPACSAGLQHVSIGGTSLLECAGCDGVWMDAGDFERMCADREAQSAVLHRFTAPSPSRAERRVRYRRCVRCGKMMNRVNFGRLSGTIVDVCRGHGTFMDAGELHQIAAFIQAGGLDRAREQQIEELKEEQKRLLDAERRAAAIERAGRASGIDARMHTTRSWSADAFGALLKALKDTK
jgi:Zn-finger nucleic acid-binding protein